MPPAECLPACMSDVSDVRVSLCCTHAHTPLSLLAVSSFKVTLMCKEEAEGIAELRLVWWLFGDTEYVTFSFKLEKACSGMYMPFTVRNIV